MGTLYSVLEYSGQQRIIFSAVNEYHCCGMHDVKRRGLKKALQEHHFALLPEKARDRFSSCFLQMLYICLKVSVLLRASCLPLDSKQTFCAKKKCLK